MRGVVVSVVGAGELVWWRLGLTLLKGREEEVTAVGSIGRGVNVA